jgi:hypothetical protein
MQLAMNFIETPSISTSASLVEMRIGVWSARKQDKAASTEITASKNADAGVATVNKKLLGNCPELDAIQKFAANVRTEHYRMTLPWSDMGPRLLPTTKFFAYQSALTRLQAEFDTLVDTFMSVYASMVSDAELKLGDLFDSAEYPDASSVRDKFYFRINYLPVPDAGDWRLDIAADAQEQLRAQYAQHYEAQLNGAMRDIWQRLHDTLAMLSRQLADQTEDGKTPKIYSSVFDRALEVLDLMETCNLTGDPSMQLMQRKLAAAFRGVTVESVKDDAFLRRDTKQAIDDAIKALPSLWG